MAGSIKTTERNGSVVSVALCREGDDVLFITSSGMLVRTPVAEISTIGRNTQGVRLVNLKDGDKLVALEVVSETDLERYASEARARPVVITDPAGEGEEADTVEDDEETPEPRDDDGGED